eukprot:CAMPEP_0172578504 /NCGR_PEP_ID=MMETSP1067-20121228/138769_1 /TAXON_ID=265564 ORGANISM="Thalassiosira punctigera, Strain Tpunct2005C2" /NCGR_SAMPLE_ID=MMETSP1067 /ASSEMBLY_ACC=CAM_ASM_000444 /LENGTH=1253 /DNA_ID=CAMNT_0013371201 /DNA_START=412 /DNA_END=4173 /DNA_ORIENTATION=-
MALSRSHCPQPPLDDAVTGGSSSVSCDVHFSGMNVRLDPLERCAPHRIVVPQNEEDTDRIRGELDGTYDPHFGEQRSATWNAITALSSLCEEVHELDATFQSQILPSIVLFGADDAAALNRPESKKDILDEEAQRRRESALLARIGKFLPALQAASNGTARLRRLVKNMVVQLGAVQTPSAVPFYYDERQSGEEQEGGGGSGDGEDGMSASATNNAASASANGVGNRANGGQSVQSPVFGPGVPMFRLGKAISIALRILVAVDSSVSSNADLQEAWAMYKDVVMEWSEQKRTDNTLDSEFESFERMMVQLDFNLLSSRSFITAIEQNFDPRGRFQAAKFPLYDEIKSILVTLYGQYCERINTEQETSTERLDCVGMYAMYVLYRHLLPPKIVPDAKLHKSLWSVFPVMCPIMELYGPLYFIPREFMMSYAPYKAVKGCSADIPEIRSGAAAMVIKWNGSFKARVAKIRLDALGWIAMADSELSPIVPEPHSRPRSEDDDEDMHDNILASSVASIEAATSTILQGMKIAHSASILLRSQLIAHRALRLNYDPDHLPSLMSLMEVLKSIEKVLIVRRRSAVLSFQRSTLKMIASNILKKFDKVRSFVDQCSSSMDFSRNSERARSITRLSACLTALEGVLKGTASFSCIRRHSIAFAIAACMDTMILEVFSTDDLLAVEGHLKDLSQVASIEETLKQVCDCSFLYFYRDLFPECVRRLYQSNLNSAISHTQLVLTAFSDPERILKHVRHLDRESLTGVTTCFTGYRKCVLSNLKEEYLGPICEMVETDLRLAASGTKGVDGRLRKLIVSSPLYVCQTKLDVKCEVEKYLERMFYDLCTLNLNDCNTYTEMRSIANERYGLNLTDPYLPDGSLDQGVDFMDDILRDLDSFIAQYNYNLIEQSFVERRPERGAKYLNTMNIKCISASFKQHGLGVVSSAVNVCYKLLARKFQLLTEFFASDNIHSLLSREFRWFENQKSEGKGIYPFGRASTFAQEVKKLDIDSVNKLDECRIIISEIGNVIALVRMVRAAKRSVFSDEMPFLPSYATPADALDAEGPQSKANAKSGVDDAISTILTKQDTDFVRAFVNVFRGVIQKSDNSFMESFFCFVPALCLCWMEASIQGKEIMHKKNITRDGYYTDDGFAVGLAFTLSVLGQTKTYESLNWFKSIQSKYAADEEDLMEKKNAQEVKRSAKIAASKQSSWFLSNVEDNTQEEDDEMTILHMMGKRLEGNRREMAMLFFSMHGAQAFFKDIRSN